jgi:hypothetical protein
MRPPRDLPSEMGHFLNDKNVENLLQGRLDPDDAPPGYSQVAQLLAAVAEPEPIQPSMERMTIDAMAAAIAALPASPDFVGEPPANALAKVKSRLSRARLVGAIAVAGVLGTAGLAYAGDLPGPAQNFASHMFAKIGLSIPGDHGKGGDVSDIAKTTKGTGGTKGQVVCTAASNANCQNGQQGQHGGQGCLPVPTPSAVTTPSCSPGNSGGNGGGNGNGNGGPGNPGGGPGNSGGGNSGGSGNGGSANSGPGNSGGHGNPNNP